MSSRTGGRWSSYSAKAKENEGDWQGRLEAESSHPGYHGDTAIKKEGYDDMSDDDAELVGITQTVRRRATHARASYATGFSGS